MTAPLSSASAEAVQCALKDAYPHSILAVDVRDDGRAPCLSVYAIDPELRGDDIAWRCADLYARALAVINLPVEVDVEGHAGAGCRIDGETNGLADVFSKEHGVEAIVAFAWGEAAGPESGKLEAFAYDPIQAAILNGILNRKHR